MAFRPPDFSRILLASELVPGPAGGSNGVDNAERGESRKNKAMRQLAFRVPADLAQRVEDLAERVGLHLSNFLRLVVKECIPPYEGRAEGIERGEDRRE